VGKPPISEQNPFGLLDARFSAYRQDEPEPTGGTA
jgi:hypothetical protein